MTISTKNKLRAARITYSVFRGLRRLVGKGPETIVTRSGIVWALDLREGIDLSIYLLGRFEPGTQKILLAQVRPGNIVLDIGANMGAHTLALARAAGDTGHVYAFEPTEFAFAKLQKNLALNPTLAARVTSEQILLTESPNEAIPQELYASWPLESKKELHENHQGQRTTTRHAKGITLDDYVQHSNFPKIDFIKIDVDGNETSVLLGAAKTLEKYRPRIVMELANYDPEKNVSNLEKLVELFKKVRYRLRVPGRSQALTLEAHALQQLTPDRADINVIAEPEETPV